MGFTRLLVEVEVAFGGMMTMTLVDNLDDNLHVEQYVCSLFLVSRMTVCPRKVMFHKRSWVSIPVFCGLLVN